MEKENSPKKIMTTKIPTASIDETVGDIEKLLLKTINKFESIDYVYVLDDNKKLKGVISIKDLFRQKKTTKISKVMTKKVITARHTTTQERVAYLALEHKIKAIPIIDKDDKFLGAVLNDSILRTLHEEASEDLLHFAGIHRGKAILDNVLDISIFKSLRHRLPWLIIGLIGGILAAKIVGHYESTLEKNIILAAFIPLIVYLADAVGTQMEAFIIRDTALNPNLNFIKYFFKQFLIVGIIGIISGLALLGTSIVFYGDIKLGMVLGLAIFIAIISSIATGLLIPYLFLRLKLDPANASGPLATIIQDIWSVTIYFIIASWLL